MFAPIINVEELVKAKILAVGDSEFTKFAMNEWMAYRDDICEQIYVLVGKYRSFQQQMDTAITAVDNIINQMLNNCSDLKKSQECYYTTSMFCTEQQLDLIERYVDEVEKVSQRIATQFNSTLGTTAIYEVIWQITQVLTKLKSSGYPRFYFQVNYNASEHVVRVELYDPFDMIPENQKIHNIPVLIKEEQNSCESTQNDPFVDVPHDSDIAVEKPIKKRCTQRVMGERNLAVLNLIKMIADIGGTPTTALLRGFFKQAYGTEINRILNAQINCGCVCKEEHNIRPSYALTDKGMSRVEKLKPIELSWIGWFKEIFNDQKLYDKAVMYLTQQSQSALRKDCGIYIPLILAGILKHTDDGVALTEFGEKVKGWYTEELNASNQKEIMGDAN